MKSNPDTGRDASSSSTGGHHTGTTVIRGNRLQAQVGILSRTQTWPHLQLGGTAQRAKKAFLGEQPTCGAAHHRPPEQFASCISPPFSLQLAHSGVAFPSLPKGTCPWHTLGAFGDSLFLKFNSTSPRISSLSGFSPTPPARLSQSFCHVSFSS